jgi:hypothetical protein
MPNEFYPGFCRHTGALDAIKRNDIIMAASNVLGAIGGNRYEDVDDSNLDMDDTLSSYYDPAGLVDYTYGYNDYGYGYQNGRSPPAYSDYSGVITKPPPPATSRQPFYADTPVEERPKKTTKTKTTSSTSQRNKKKNAPLYERDSTESQVCTSNIL